MSDTTQTPSFRDTLNLPRTDFSMRADLTKREPDSLARWTGLYERIRKARQGADVFRFHDGPPYANGSLHLGHLLNRTLKDFVVRTRTMAGLDCPYIPGWDCHGLPIEHRVMSELHASGELARIASLPPDEQRMTIRRACAAYAEKHIALQKGQMQRLLTLADYDQPYRTMDPAYEAEALELFAQLVEKNLVYRALKSVHWSIENRTALAEAELEYYEREDESVYVEFEAVDRAAVARVFGLEDVDRTPTFMIWTTTPWTLPANLAIAVQPRAQYALVDLAGSLTVVAAELVERVASKTDSKAKTLATCPGERLVGLRYRHPLYDEPAEARLRALGADPQAPLWTIVAAEHVTLEDGTGLVHTAPGHGREDELVGRACGLPIYCPVRDDGTYDQSVPADLQGMLVWDANPKIVQQLRDSGHLHHSERIRHSYPHDWRGKSPVIFRATEQWFIRVDGDGAKAPNLRRLGLEATQRDIEFIPSWGRSRLQGMLESRPDWCISRQRAWGLPIPAFVDKEGRVLLTAASVRAVAKVVREEGSDAWFTRAASELLADYDAASDPQAPQGLDVASLEKTYDIFDVWFESGASWRAVMQQRGFGFPCDLYLEGSDQHRGWFQVSLLTALGAEGRPPFRTLLTHGFMVDKDGRAMSKSLGNTLEVEDLLRDFGADVCRWWVSSLAYENDIKADRAFFQAAGDSYRKVRNTLRFLLGNLSDFTPSPAGEDASCSQGCCVALGDFPPTSPDAWVLAELSQLIRTVRNAYERYAFREAHQALYLFCSETLSAVYLASVKDRLYCDAPTSPRRRRTQTALWDLADSLCRLLAPLLPHTADEAFRALRGEEACAHLERFPEADAFSAVAVDDAWPALLAARDAALAALERQREAGGVENPLDAGVVLPDPDGRLSRFDLTDVADMLGVSRAQLDSSAEAPSVLDLRAELRCDRCWRRDASATQRDGACLCDRCAEALRQRSAAD